MTVQFSKHQQSDMPVTELDEPVVRKSTSGGFWHVAIDSTGKMVMVPAAVTSVSRPTYMRVPGEFYSLGESYRNWKAGIYIGKKLYFAYESEKIDG